MALACPTHQSSSDGDWAGRGGLPQAGEPCVREGGGERECAIRQTVTLYLEATTHLPGVEQPKRTPTHERVSRQIGRPFIESARSRRRFVTIDAGASESKNPRSSPDGRYSSLKAILFSFVAR